MKKKYFLMCMLSITSMLHAQNGSNGIYSSNNGTVTVLEKTCITQSCRWHNN